MPGFALHVTVWAQNYDDAVTFAAPSPKAPSPKAPPPVQVHPAEALRGLSLISGPANAGKVALLLERYLARLDDEPFLIVPNRPDVARVESELLELSGCLLGGTIGTFDDLFERIAASDPARRKVATQDAARAHRPPRRGLRAP